jgi:iron complex outermembrane receptor protein
MQVVRPTLRYPLMWIFNRISHLFIIALLPLFTQGQQCNLSIQGIVVDGGSSVPLELAQVTLEESKQIIYTNEHGAFLFEGLCPAGYHLTISHIGCRPKRFFLKLGKDTTLNISLDNHTELISEVHVQGDLVEDNVQASSTIDQKDILSTSTKSLGQTVYDVAGVSSITNGAGIAKPVIQGMWGNRVSIINNGIAQSGQQWGVDHAPEIDPFVADHITVIRGANALAYGGVSLGGVVVVDPGEIQPEPHIHGLVNYVFNTNGLGHTINAKLEQGKPGASWRIAGTIKYIGDRRAPDYFQTNTGNREANIAATVEKEFSSRLKASVYYSLFNTEIGILRGSHISNSTDLESAIGRDEPFFTNDDFSYDIQAPRQLVQHHLFKAKAKYLLNDEQFLSFQYGGQLNKRNEYDVRRAGRSDRPALSLEMISHFLEAYHSWQTSSNWQLKSGIQYDFTDNNNDNASTGRMPLIPDYRSNKLSVYSIANLKKGKWHTEFGGRFDARFLEAITISETLPREIERKDHVFNNYNLAGGIAYDWTRWLDVKLDLGYVQRQPEVNELYSSGLHQGLASMEYGNPNLVAETSLKSILTLEMQINSKWFAQFSAYYHQIDDYIFLNPTGEFELNISGSFPIFRYEQTDARIVGSDILISYAILPELKATVIASVLRGDDLSKGIPLVFMPANNLLARLTYSLKDGSRFKNSSTWISGRYVARQDHLLPEQDFLVPPQGYFLMEVNFQTSYSWGLQALDVGIRIENLLNTRYRDYLNRMRYFSDDLGRNIFVRVAYNF